MKVAEKTMQSVLNNATDRQGGRRRDRTRESIPIEMEAEMATENQPLQHDGKSAITCG